MEHDIIYEQKTKIIARLLILRRNLDYKSRHAADLLDV